MSEDEHRWSAEVTEHSDAMDIEHGTFSHDDPHEIALALKHAAESSERRKSDPFRSAMSMLNFYINRAGKNLSRAEHEKLERTKPELRKVFGRPPE
ncbi:hypothetical protein AA101099_1330 [Neoasaia chiangmaiensis NBRC 101099]|uniref:Uncharacterized protein n=1 Tax=Neoasaia chiangmaiensis TaxID=320497 RepID=A0A1U9KQK9_9PROT|nr:DUF3175 domain-containing protein [Neoasaia chiangmaiensis]AQS88076.1 hypothetical protein A0U93_09090 [Neoasaia chiangmaiensis]GBR38739.1 hypothetical protein AA101099_1330 [Neoasaia chiangmaiensis NBRC 101099]GEN15754.1 hypothetical protein NCH01_21850 [Neoasaia chiangmaiensis]